jgi:amino acid adenylation domain-containing protein
MSGRRLHEGFLRSAEVHPQRPALEVDGKALSYADMRQRVLAVAATLVARRRAGGSPLSCVLGQRTVGGFVGILATLCSGHGYVPMLPTYPAARLALMIDRSRSNELLVDSGGLRVLPDVLAAVGKPMNVVLLDVEPDDALRSRCEGHTLIGPSELADATGFTPPEVRPDDVAYLLFTSGSTGQPKAVMVAHRNIERFIDVVVDRYDLRAEDRFSHLFEVTFDLSLFDMFAAWQVGGCLCVPNAQQRMLPARYVTDSELSVWFSVPSTALLMKETRALAPDMFPGLRLALFCGEALTVAVAEAFAEAASKAIVENIYGPTELTLACTYYRFGPMAAEQAVGDVVPIGDPFPGMHAKVVDEDLRDVPPGESGELIMAGPQVALGYWDDPERTAASFVRPPGEIAIFYRTGDRVVRPVREDPLVFLGRLDSQIKIRGYRVELGEIEAALRQEAGVDTAVALGWPLAAAGGAEGVVAFIDDASVDTAALLRRVGTRLPRYMVPREVRVVESFPLNANGKVDRNALRALLG